MINQHHYLPRSIKLNYPTPQSEAHWAFSPDQKRIIIFVHGFNGHATKTWNEFTKYLVSGESMTDDFHQLKGTDILFYGYESVTKQVWTNMGRLLDLLDLIGTNPSETVVNPTLKTEWHRDKHFSYDHIILVGHSLGGVLCREALLKAYRKPNRPDWLKKVSLILFAPAHMGARLAHLVKEVKFPYLPLGAVYGLVRLYAQVLGDIEENCEHLKELRQETRKCLEDDPLAPLKAACVVHGSDDRVVVLSDFIHDEETKRKDGKGHISVCKPLPSYEDPFSLVMGIRP